MDPLWPFVDPYIKGPLEALNESPYKAPIKGPKGPLKEYMGNIHKNFHAKSLGPCPPNVIFDGF